MGDSEKMKLSVVMTCYNKANLLEWTLLTLVEQKIPPDEIIIIDDGSSDETERIIRKFQRVYRDANIKYFYNNNPEFCTCAWGFNCGIKKATNEVIMLTKPEILHPTPDIKIILEHFQNPENDRTYIVGKPLYQVHGEDFLKKVMKENFRDPLAITQRSEIQIWHKDLESKAGMITRFIRGGLDDIMGVLRKDLLAVGGFDERFSELGHRGWEDVDLLHRLGGSDLYGLREVESHKIIAIHLHHEKPPADLNEVEDMHNKEMLEESVRNRQWKANVGKEWGVLRK